MMDRIIEDKRWIKPKHYKYIAGGIFLLLVSAFLIFRDPVSTYRVDRDKLSIDKVFRGPFKDYIRIIGIVEPISIVYLDAVEGGVVEKIITEEGAMVHKGEPILKLSNTNLNLSILYSESQLAEKANMLRETKLNMEQQRLSVSRELLQLNYQLLQKKRAYDRNKILIKDDLISKEAYQLSKDDYEMTLKMRNLTLEQQRQDSAYRKVQVMKISQNLASMQKNLQLIYKQQDNLNVRAPVDGQLGLLNAELGQNIAQGQRIGQINVLTSFKIKAQIDEHYIDRVSTGLTAVFERETDTFKLKLSKVYPEVHDGQFEVDLLFTGAQPKNIRIGQSYHISLQLGETEEAVQIARGSFFQSTGGQWVYVLSPDGQTAVKRNIRIGRQNPQYYEVLEGLNPGEKVITSGYEVFGDNDKLILK